MLSGGLQDKSTWPIQCSDMAGNFTSSSHVAFESEILGVLKDNDIGELMSEHEQLPEDEFWLVPSDYSVQNTVIKVMLPS